MGVSSHRDDGARVFDVEPQPGRGLDLGTLSDDLTIATRMLADGPADRSTIDASLAALAATFPKRLLLSVYLKEHERLWLVAQHGYREVLDGFTLDHGVMSRAVRTGVTQFIPDVRDDPDFLEATAGIVSELTIPFGVHSDGPAGAFNLETIGVTLPEETTTLFAFYAALLGQRIAEMRERLEVDVALLARLCVQASSLRGIAAIGEFAARTIGRLVELDCVELHIWDEDASGLQLASFWRRESSGLTPLDSDDVQRLVQLQDAQGLSATYHRFDLRRAGLVASPDLPCWAVWIPLTVAGERVGVIVGRASSRPDTEYDRAEAATLFAQHTAALLDVALNLRRQQQAALTDPLTGLLNRRGFDQRLHDELSRARATQSSLTLILADCDNLKLVNDSRGHDVGDRTLKQLANFIRQGEQSGDTAARIGGDEFALILPGASADNGLAIADRLRHQLRTQPIDDAPVVATFGVATFPNDAQTTDELLRAADLALYRSKRGTQLTASDRR